VGGADLHNTWNRTATRYAETMWPEIEFVSTEADGSGPTNCGEVSADCFAATAAILAAFPDVKGILTFGSQGAIGAGEYLRSIDRTDVAMVGVAVPSQGRELIQAGWIDRGFLWDPFDAGYAVVAVGDLLARGRDPLAGLTIGGGLGTATVNRDVRDIFFNRVLEITADNVDDYDF
jgi:simple sugar transport system substrate-binding protein